MNVLLKLRKDMPIASLVPFRYLLYSAMLSSVVPYVDEDDVRYGVFSEKQADLYDYFPDWDSLDERRSEVLKALNELAEEGLIWFDDEDRIYLGEYRGKKFFPFEQKNSIFDEAVELLNKELKRYGRSKSAKDKSRSRYIREKVDKILDKGVENVTPSELTDLHSYLYEIYTGGEIYTIRNKVEYFQTGNILKAYDKFTTFAILVHGTLEYDKFRHKGLPTLTTVAVMKDDVFHSLTKFDGKEYMREITSSINEDSDF